MWNKSRVLTCVEALSSGSLVFQHRPVVTFQCRPIKMRHFCFGLNVTSGTGRDGLQQCKASSLHSVSKISKLYTILSLCLSCYILLSYIQTKIWGQKKTQNWAQHCLCIRSLNALPPSEMLSFHLLVCCLDGLSTGLHYISIKFRWWMTLSPENHPTNFCWGPRWRDGSVIFLTFFKGTLCSFGEEILIGRSLLTLLEIV